MSGLAVLDLMVRGGSVTLFLLWSWLLWRDHRQALAARMAIVMNAKVAEARGLQPLGIFRGFAVAGCEPDEMGIGPVYAIPKVLKRLGLSVGDIDLWELNEAFAVQVLYCRDKLGISNDRLNVNGGAIALGHPLGASGARLITTAMYQLHRTQGRYALCTMCIGVGQGIALIIERV